MSGAGPIVNGIPMASPTPVPMPTRQPMTAVAPSMSGAGANPVSMGRGFMPNANAGLPTLAGNLPYRNVP